MPQLRCNGQTNPLVGHGYGPGFRPIGELAAKIVSDLGLRHRLQKLHGLGARATAEYVVELAVRAEAVDLLDDLLARYLRLDRASLKATGGGRFPPPPIRRAS